jgi:hypothetical protein
MKCTTGTFAGPAPAELTTAPSLEAMALDFGRRAGFAVTSTSATTSGVALVFFADLDFLAGASLAGWVSGAR